MLQRIPHKDPHRFAHETVVTAWSTVCKPHVRLNIVGLCVRCCLLCVECWVLCTVCCMLCYWVLCNVCRVLCGEYYILCIPCGVFCLCSMLCLVHCVSCVNSFRWKYCCLRILWNRADEDYKELPLAFTLATCWPAQDKSDGQRLELKRNVQW